MQNSTDIRTNSSVSDWVADTSHRLEFYVASDFGASLRFVYIHEYSKISSSFLKIEYFTILFTTSFLHRFIPVIANLLKLLTELIYNIYICSGRSTRWYLALLDATLTKVEQLSAAGSYMRLSSKRANARPVGIQAASTSPYSINLYENHLYHLTVFFVFPDLTNLF